jgi:hypothetical protein
VHRWTKRRPYFYQTRRRNPERVHCTLSNADKGICLHVPHAIEFIETPTFTRQFQAIATDDELKELQRVLIAQPNKGDLIQGTGGLRKIRIGLGQQGKRGGGRVIYFLASTEIIYLILAYPKNVKDNLRDRAPPGHHYRFRSR